jgi:alkylation response protein AidB-like acyl-CoA dehydrogenase
VFRLQVPASRIVGGYAIKDGVIVPHRNHLDVLRPIFTRVRAPVGIMAAAKLLSAVEPVIRYQRERFGGSDEAADVLHRERGLQTHEDAVHRLVDVWATGEAAASLGFAAARQLDDVDSLDRERDAIFAALGVQSPAAVREARQEAARLALEYVQLASAGEADREQSRWEELNSNRLVELALKECVSNVLSPAAKLWNTSQGSAMLREAVSLMGGTGVLENCPGFLPQKWFDSQIEATYEGPESVHRRQLATSMANEVFLAQFAQWLDDLRRLAARQPGTGACTVASAMAVWLWTLRRLQDAKDADGLPLFRDQRQGATFPMADALDWLLASRCQILDVVELQTRGPQCESSGESLAGCLGLLTDLCHVQAARAAGEVARICTDLLFGYNRHPSWDAACGHCLPGDEIDALEGVIPGISVGARIAGDVIEADGSHDQKAGPCVRFAGLYEFVRRRSKLDGCLTGARLAKDRAARSLAQITIPVALDYPQ